MARLIAALRSLEDPDAPRRAREILELGFAGLGLATPLYWSDWQDLRAMLPRDALAMAEVFAPLPPGVRRGQACPFRLGSRHVEDKRDALKHGLETLQFAGENEIPVVLVPPFKLDGDLRAQMLRVLRGPHSAALLPAVDAGRKQLVVAHLDSYRSVLSRLLDGADRHGVQLAIQPGTWVDEAPDLEETAACLREFRGAPLSVWLDTLGLSVAALRGQEGKSKALRLWEGLRVETTGVTLRDSIQDDPTALEEKPPGRGSTDWSCVAPLLPESAVWMVNPPQGPQRAALSWSLSFLEHLGEGEKEPPAPGFRLS